MKRAHRAPQQRQQGVALLVGLILLIIMTLLGLSGMRSIVHQEKMATGTYDRSLMFQAAEAALRQAEERVESDKPTPTASGCVDGICTPLAASATPRWKDTSFTGWYTASTTQSLAGAAQYIVEYMGSDYPCDPSVETSPSTCKNYRITARSAPTAQRATVVVQSIYLTD